MSVIAALDSNLEQINSSVQLIRAQLLAIGGLERNADEISIADFLSTAPLEVKDARKRLHEGLSSLQRISTGPIELWEQMTLNNQYLSCLRWALHFNIPTIIPLDGAVPYTEVALAANVPVHQLRHVVRMLITNGCFAEAKAGEMMHSPLSAKFVAGSLYRDANHFLTEITSATTYRMTEMTAQYHGSEKPNETAFNIALQTRLPFFGYLSQNPSVAAELAAGMKVLGGQDGTHTRHLINGYEWQKLGNAKIIDVGGSSGHASIALAEAYPDLTFEVQDLPAVIAKTRETPLPVAVAGRIVYTVHDFFQPQPPSSSDASVFLVRLILQNHSVSAAQAILRNISAAMRPGAVLLINNTLLPKPGSVGLREEALERARSLFMMQAMNGMDRDETEFHALVEGASAGLKIKEIRSPGGGVMALIVIEKATGSL